MHSDCLSLSLSLYRCVCNRCVCIYYIYIYNIYVCICLCICYVYIVCVSVCLWICLLRWLLLGRVTWRPPVDRAVAAAAMAPMPSAAEGERGRKPTLCSPLPSAFQIRWWRWAPQLSNSLNEIVQVCCDLCVCLMVIVLKNSRCLCVCPLFLVLCTEHYAQRKEPEARLFIAHTKAAPRALSARSPLQARATAVGQDGLG